MSIEPLQSVLDTPDGQKKNTESSDLQKWMMEDHLEQLKDISSELAKSGIQVSIKHSSGKPYLKIVREALKGGFDLIMKQAENEPALKTILFGSTDMQLFHLSPCPVWIFKPTLNTELRRIMVAVDLLADDEEKSALADRVLQWGKHVSSMVGSELHVVHIWHLFGEAKLRGRSLNAKTVDKLVQDVERKQRQWLNEALAKKGWNKKRYRYIFAKVMQSI